MPSASRQQQRAALEAAVARIASEAEGSAATPASIQDLLSLREGHLAADEERSLLEKLAGRPSSAEQLREIDAFLEPPDPDAPEDLEARAAWLATRDQMFDHGATTSTSKAGTSERERWSRLPAALAAGLAVVAIGLGAWNARLARHIETLEAGSAGSAATSGGSAEVMTTDVQDVYDTRSRLRQVGDEEAASEEGSLHQRVAVPTASASVTLLFHTAEGLAPGDYRVELRAGEHRDGEALWSASRLRPSSTGSLALVFPRAALPSGKATLWVFHSGQGGDDPVTHFRLEVVSAR